MRLHINHDHKFSWVQTVWLIIAFVLFTGGVIAVFAGYQSMNGVARPLGIVMMVAGILNLIVCEYKSHIIHGSRWLIADGICAILLSLFPLFNEIISPVMIPFFFGMWELFSGVLKVMDSSELKHDKIECWMGFAIIGWIELVSGTISLMKPFDDLVGIDTVIAMIFFIQSGGFVLKSATYKYLTK